VNPLLRFGQGVDFFGSRSEQRSSREVGTETAFDIDKDRWMVGPADGKGKPPADRILDTLAIPHLDEEGRRRGILCDRPDIGYPLRRHPDLIALARAEEIRVVVFAETGLRTVDLDLAIAPSPQDKLIVPAARPYDV
jgi:hypothetical protein